MMLTVAGGCWLLVVTGRDVGGCCGAGTPGEVYNIGSGHVYGMDQLMELVRGKSKVDIRLVEDKQRLRIFDEKVGTTLQPVFCERDECYWCFTACWHEWLVSVL